MKLRISALLLSLVNDWDSIKSFAKFTFHSSFVGMLWYTSPLMSWCESSFTLDLPTRNRMVRKFFPVVDRQTSFTITIIFLSTSFLDSMTFVVKFTNLLIRARWMCLVSEIGSMKNRWVFLGMRNIILCEMFHDFSNRIASFEKRSHNCDS